MRLESVPINMRLLIVSTDNAIRNYAYKYSFSKCADK
jgi:hypothetical protein